MDSRELECLECKQLNAIEIGHDAYLKGLERAAQIAEVFFVGKSYCSVGRRIAAAIRKELADSSE